MRRSIIILIVILFASLTIQAKESTIAILKTISQNGLESEISALPEIISAKILKYQNFSILMYDQFETRLGKDRLSEINRCHDSLCIIRFSEAISRLGFRPEFLLFSSVAKWGSNLNITIEIADARNGVTFGVASTSIPTLESFHSSTVLDNLIKKIPVYNKRISQDNDKVTLPLFPGIDAIGKDTSFFTQLLNDKKTLYTYVNIINFHDERRPLVINTLRTTDSTHYPLINIYKSKSINPDSALISFIMIQFSDSIQGMLANVSINFKGKSKINRIDEVIFTSDVPSQSKFGSTYIDLKTALINKINNANFSSIKADSISGLYGVKYNYYYKSNGQSNLRLHLIAEDSKFILNLKRE